MMWYSKIASIFNTPGGAVPEENCEPKELKKNLKGNLLDDMINIRALCSNTSDFQDREIKISGVDTAFLLCEGMINMQLFTQILVRPMMDLQIKECTGEKLADWIAHKAILSGDQKEFYTYDELFSFLMSGFVIILIDGVSHGIACGLQGFSTRSISEPSTEMNIRGSREGFVEAIRINLSMVRRRIKSPTLKFELYPLGDKSKTDICLVYLTDTVKPELVEAAKRQLRGISSDIILNAGYLQPYLEGRRASIFSTISTTDRPDTLAAKVNEGRIAILVDGTPFALIIPTLFSEHFQSMDDYAYRAYYATFIRLLKYFAFLISIFLPGLYVAVTVFNPEMIPDTLLFNIAVSEQITPFSMMTEAFVIHLIYELMREAGLRLPRPVGHAVSIVGALVIGDAAVTAGIIGSSMVMVVALTAISSFVVPSLYEPVAILKFVFIIVGGTWGLYGISVGFMILMVNLCSATSFGVPITSPTTPFSGEDMRDTYFRQSWTKLGKKRLRIQNLPGSDLK